MKVCKTQKNCSGTRSQTGLSTFVVRQSYVPHLHER